MSILQTIVNNPYSAEWVIGIALCILACSALGIAVTQGISIRKQLSSMQYNAERPILVISDEQDALQATFSEIHTYEMHLKNVGRGTAFNVACVLFAMKEDAHWSAIIQAPLSAEETRSIHFIKMPLSFIKSNKKMYGERLFPSSHTTCKVFISYTDIFLRKHVSIFERTPEFQWLLVHHRSNVQKDTPAYIRKFTTADRTKLLQALTQRYKVDGTQRLVAATPKRSNI